ncbi:hypothetical protein FQN60_006220 [Etheostoma spectabile]|uniref:Uncharacterized protein n=1 Tax=Etheostoma spectabile TaxID=54343 RepID=A0A5J5CNN8_9PERO|nr:hypothetical protein FQN60_006220 [Etheostoma spectabile]
MRRRTQQLGHFTPCHPLIGQVVVSQSQKAFSTLQLGR